MKKFRMFAVAALTALAVAASAQVTYGNDYGYAPTKSNIYGADNEGFGLFYLQYNPSQSHLSYEGHSVNSSFNAISLGYSYYIPLGDIPLYLAPGAAVQWAFKSSTEGSAEYKMNNIAVKIPVNLMYSFAVSDAFRIEPYVGAYARVNIWGEQKETYGGQTEKENPYSGDHALKRFLAGWNAGINFRITDAFTIGGGYYMDLIKISDHLNYQGFDITVGVNF